MLPLRSVVLTSVVALAACFPTPTPQHAVWHEGRRLEIQGAPLPLGLGPYLDDDGEEGVSASWPGLLGGRVGHGTRRLRGTVGAFIGMTLYGDASLTLRLVQLGRVHTAIAVEGGAGGALLTASQVLGDLVGENELSGVFTWGRVRPMVTFARADAMDAGGSAFTLAGSYGTFAGVREVGGSIGFLFLGKPDDYTRRDSLDTFHTRESRVVDWDAGGVSLDVLWHGERSAPTALLSFHWAFGRKVLRSKIDVWDPRGR